VLLSSTVESVSHAGGVVVANQRGLDRPQFDGVRTLSDDEQRHVATPQQRQGEVAVDQLRRPTATGHLLEVRTAITRLQDLSRRRTVRPAVAQPSPDDAVAGFADVDLDRRRLLPQTRRDFRRLYQLDILTLIMRKGMENLSN